MVSLVLSRLQIFLPALALVILLGGLAPSAAFAAFKYEIYDDVEGDPGDGVLDPAVESNVPPAGGRKLDPVVATSDGLWPDAWPLPLGNLYLVPLQLPGGLPGHGTVFFLPRAWSRDDASVRRYEGRWHNAP